MVAHKKRKHSHLQHPLNDLRYGVLAAHKELETTFKGTVHKFASEANNQDIVDFADKQAQQYLDVRDYDLPNSKKQKRSNETMKSRSRRSARPTRKARQYSVLRTKSKIRSRKPRYTRRPRVSSRLKMRILASKIATAIAEPRRHVTQQSSLALSNVTIKWFPLSRIPLGVGSLETTFSYLGKKVFIKGIRIKGQIVNKGQIPSVGNIFILSNKEEASWKDLSIVPTGDAEKLFWNPLTCQKTNYGLLPTDFKLNSKMAPDIGWRKHKDIVYKLASTHRNQGLEGTDPAWEPGLDTTDTLNFDIYIPINRQMTVNSGGIDLNRFEREYFIGFQTMPHALDLASTIVPTSGVQTSWTSICYFKDL